MAKDKTFTLFWRTGDAELVEGRNIAEAMTLAGYGGGAVGALEFHGQGDIRERYEWNKEKGDWEPTPKHPNWKSFQQAVAI